MRAEGSELAPPGSAARIEPSVTPGEGSCSRCRAPEQGLRRSLTCNGVSASPMAAGSFTKHAGSVASALSQPLRCKSVSRPGGSGKRASSSAALFSLSRDRSPLLGA
ncbi:hypothetical protein NDU88_009238 [Pleurodeles waltl]|uniref:Uncharacterized protein n=1 Tax=Pleurodeles waltl TaxID=8319 RepID=A0AAV7PVD7_PLEWA|nr:hypothetical protein NDU88_009238 [Pleurodeles waltl]